MTPDPELEFDHVVLATDDLARGASDLEQDTGLAAMAGGRHLGHGTHNAIVPLDHGYIELVAIADPAEAETSPFGRAVAARNAEGGGLFAVCLRTVDMASVANRLGLTATPMERTTPAGTRLEWQLAGLTEALDRGLPFFIEWAVDPTEHPSRGAAPHTRQPREIAWVELPVDPIELNRWVGPSGLDLRPVPPGTPMRAAIGTAQGQIII